MTDKDIGSHIIIYMQKEEKNTFFSDLGIEKNFLEVLTNKEFINPTPIQRQVIPSALKGKDIVGIAQTGTGKTLAFGIPMIQRLALNPGQGLILLPTRELALQVEQALMQVGRQFGLKTATLIGGTSKQPQIRDLQRNPHIIIATPGRLVDLMNQGICKLNKVNIVTLDEADRMLDIGFLPEIKRILKTIKTDRQTMLFSATMPKSISSLATAFMKMPLRIEIAPQGTSVENIEQEVFIVRKNDKMRLLDSILEEYKDNIVLIFSRTKHGAKRIARDIRDMNHTATEIHSNRSQTQRKASLDGFKKGKFRIMVATDIAARGIDVKDISIVINFDLPENSEDYVHRIGRTGRAGKSGKAISFVTPSQKADIRKIERLIRKSLPTLALPELPPERENKYRNEDKEYTPQRGSYSKGRSGGRSNGNSRGRSNGENNGNYQKRRSSSPSQGRKSSGYNKRRSSY